MTGNEKPSGWQGLRTRAENLRSETHALILAFQDQRVPWPARAVIFCVIAYALSPVDLIPDFIPLLGQLDDLILVPAGIAIAIRLIPDEVLQDARRRASGDLDAGRPAAVLAAFVVIAIWLSACLLGVFLVGRIRHAG